MLEDYKSPGLFVCNLCHGITFHRHGNFTAISECNLAWAMARQNKIFNDRLRFIFEQGLFIESCSYYNYTFSLFSLNRDFIEVLRDTNTNKIIWAMDANDQDLKKYLDKVLLSIEGILK